MKQLKTRTWILLIAGLLLVCVGASLWTARRTPGLTAGIYVNDVCVRRVDLNRVKTPERFVVEGNGGSNTILIEPGRICVESADCLDQICVMEGWLPGFPMPIVCLPHGLIIQLEEDSP